MEVHDHPQPTTVLTQMLLHVINQCSQMVVVGRVDADTNSITNEISL